MSRWLKSLNVNVASQSKQRCIAKEWTGDDIVVENVAFRFQLKDKRGQYVVKEAPWGYIADLPTHVLYYLDALSEYVLFMCKNVMINAQIKFIYYPRWLLHNNCFHIL